MTICKECFDKAILAYFDSRTDFCATCRFWKQTHAGENDRNECREDSPKNGSYDITPANGWCGKHKPIPGLKKVKCTCEVEE